jgi:ATP-dependent DNA helicase RecG
MGKDRKPILLAKYPQILFIGKIIIMKTSIEKLQKFFKLEADRGYDNKAVLGGLAQMLDNWVPDARLDQLDEDLIQAIISRLNDYDHLSEISRKETLYGLWNRIKRESGIDSEDKNQKPDLSTTPPPVQQSPDTVDPLPESKHEPVTTKKKESKVEKKQPTKPEGPPAALGSDITVLKNVGPRHASTLERMSIYTLGDMMYHFPRRYDDYTKLKPINRLRVGEEVTVIGTIKSINTRPIRGGRSKLSEAVVGDSTGALRLTWFNQPWIGQRLKKGMQIVLSGKVDQYLGHFTLNNPEWESLEQKHLHTNRIVPVYPLTARITQRWLRNLMHKVISYWAPRVYETMPEHVIQEADLVRLPQALKQIHFPDSWDELESARYRLAFEEIFLLQMGVLQQKMKWQSRNAQPFIIDDPALSSLTSLLPYKLTDAQNKAITDIRQDLSSGKPMNRLLQGDVGSGKTAVAAMAIGIVTTLGSQAAIMAPTSILAEQHFMSLKNILNADSRLEEQLSIRLLVGATPEEEKKEIYDSIATGGTKLVIGTHALIEDPLEFQDLQLVIIDEQHRFGVNQRASLRSKGRNPHLLVMTATPIPRSLALTIYGDLDLSVIDKMPPGRQIVETHLINASDRERAYRLISREIEAGHQAFVIYPLVQESEKSEEKAAIEEQVRLQEEVFPDNKVGLLHGRMRPDEKETTMTDFRDGEFEILVSTSVVEVGVDIPNATVMLIEGAHRFGLAQLHQFRGRVGRGEAKSYCILIPNSAEAGENERLTAMVETSDGFLLAEKDLKQRGAGDFLGTRQSGFAELKMANLTDIKIIEKARKQAQSIFNHDPELADPENQCLIEAMDRFWRIKGGDIS